MGEISPGGGGEASIDHGDDAVAARGDALRAQEDAEIGRALAGAEQDEDGGARGVPVGFEGGDFLLGEIVLRGDDGNAVGSLRDFGEAGEVGRGEANVLVAQGGGEIAPRGVLPLGIDARFVGEEKQVAGFPFDRLDKAGGEEVFGAEILRAALALFVHGVGHHFLGKGDGDVGVECGCACRGFRDDGGGLVRAGVDEDEVADQGEVVGGGELRGAVRGADGIDDLKLDFFPGSAPVFLRERPDTLVKGSGAAEGHDPFHRPWARCDGTALQVIPGGGGECVVRAAGEIGAGVVLRG